MSTNITEDIVKKSELTPNEYHKVSKVGFANLPCLMMAPVQY